MSECFAQLAEDLTTVAAIAGLVVLGLRSGADPSMVVLGVSGLGGYRLHRQK